MTTILFILAGILFMGIILFIILLFSVGRAMHKNQVKMSLKEGRIILNAKDNK